MHRAGGDVALRLQSLVFGVLLAVACSAQSPPRARAQSDGPSVASELAPSWSQLAALAVEAIDWSRVCDSGASCETILVDSVVRLSVVGHDPRAATLVIATIRASQLPRAANRFVLGARESSPAGVDGVLTIVVSESASLDAATPPMDIVVHLLRPRKDDVYIRVFAARRDAKWTVDSLIYSHS